MSFKLHTNYINGTDAANRVSNKFATVPNTKVNTPARDIFQRSDFSAEKENYIKKSPLLSQYNNVKYEYSFKEVSFNLLDNAANIKDLENIENKCKEIKSAFSDYYYDDEFPGELLKITLDLEHFRPDTYKYITESKENKRCFRKFCEENKFNSGVYHCIKNLSPGVIDEIKKAQEKYPVQFDDFCCKYDESYYANLYIYRPAYIYDNDENIEKLNKYLAQNTTDSDLKVTRAEKHTGLFNKIPISEALQKEIKKSNFFNQLKTRREYFDGYETSFSSDDTNSNDSVYDYIKNKEKLSLADAMYMMKYLNDKTQAEVTEEVKNTTFENDGFVSTSFSEEFPEKWLYKTSKSPRRTGIMNEITIPKGTQGIYLNQPNGQFEFLINNNKKDFKVTSAEYDKERNTFNIKTEMKAVYCGERYAVCLPQKQQNLYFARNG